MYIKTSNNCKTCIHEDVCRHEECIQDVFINDNAGDIREIIEIDISCKLYETRYQTLVDDRKG